MKLVIPLVSFFLFFSSCMLGTDSSSPFPVEGTIIHNQSSASSLNEDFIFDDDSFLLITVSHKTGDQGMKVVYEKRVEDISSLPYYFTIDPDESFPEGVEYSLKAEVLANDTNVLFAGDLASEKLYPLSGNRKLSEVEVFGLEDCNADFADNFCTFRNGISQNCSAIGGNRFAGPPVPIPCTGGEGCGSPGYLYFSPDSNEAFLSAINSDAVLIFSFIQDDAQITLYSDYSEEYTEEFNLINNCKEIQQKRNGNVYRDMEYSWSETIH